MVYRLATQVENSNNYFEIDKKKTVRNIVFFFFFQFLSLGQGLHATDLFFQILKNVSQSDAR